MRAMGVADYPVQERPIILGEGDMPDGLEKVCRKLEQINNGKGILPLTSKVYSPITIFRSFHLFL